ncbi:DUF302 domain-containing protein [Roseibium polysiphoniae]|uniref:DUF302 domain-containing protein n=1 Tax=Roseibium polysiphoniae TaxID=2571221 RepID=UPI00329A09D4
MTGLFKTALVASGLALAMPVGASSADMAQGSGPEGVTVYQVTGDFEDVRFDLESAIVNRGLVIDYTSHIGEMLARTKDDVGGAKDLYANAEAMLFCSANLSRKVMEADIANIAYCPYAVFAYEAATDPGTVMVGFRHLAETGSEASKKAIGEVNALLDGIAKEAAGE